MKIAPNKIGDAYEALQAAFLTAAEAAGKGEAVKFPDRPVRSCFSQSGIERAIFERYLYLKGWPCRQLGSNKRLDILLKALETFKTPEWVLIKSTVYLNYFVVSSSKARLVQSLHYDFVEGGQIGHPLFHAQLNMELIPMPEQELRSMSFDVELVPYAPDECWVTTRIPTPDMTFPSVLYCLVADHLEAGIFKPFAEKVNSMLQDKLPPPNFDSLMSSFEQSSAHFKSSHWFTHMLGPTSGR